jgi:hypothetical protein
MYHAENATPLTTRRLPKQKLKIMKGFEKVLHLPLKAICPNATRMWANATTMKPI